MKELMPVYDNAKSFYRKAFVDFPDDDTAILYSYDTPIIRYRYGVYTKLWDGYSATTMRHIKEFCKQVDGINVNKKWWTAL